VKNNNNKIIKWPKGKLDKFFDELRKDYGVRREFQNTRIVLADSVQRIAKGLLRS